MRKREIQGGLTKQLSCTYQVLAFLCILVDAIASDQSKASQEGPKNWKNFQIPVLDCDVGFIPSSLQWDKPKL